MEHWIIGTWPEAGLLAATIVLFLIQVWYYRAVYNRPYRRQQREEKAAGSAQPPVSVIVYAKNESENLRRNLYAVLQQEYPEYQVVVVNDGSTDESDDVLKRYENQYPHLYHTYVPEDVKYLSRKKLALTIGIKAAKYDILLFTEAGCLPSSPRWIARMARHFTEGTDLVLGFCAYDASKGLLNKLAAYDNLLTGLQYLASALAGHPYTGNGKNLAYRKKLFFDHKGYSQTLNLQAGDDDLFVNRLATGSNTRVEYSPESITRIVPFDRLRVWKEMKVSRAATMRYYRGGQPAFYRAGAWCRFLFLLGCAALIVTGFTGNPVSAAAGAGLYALFFLIQAVVLRKSARMLGQKPLTGWLPLLNVVLPVYDLYVRIYRLFRGKSDYTFRLGNK